MKTKKLNEESLRFIDEVTEKHKDEMGPVIVMLHDIQKELGYIPIEAMAKVGGCLWGLCGKCLWSGDILYPVYN